MVELSFLQYGSFGALILFLVFAARWFTARDKKQQEQFAEERTAQLAQIASDREFLYTLISREQEQQDQHTEAWIQLAKRADESITHTAEVLDSIRTSFVTHVENSAKRGQEMREFILSLHPAQRETC